MTQSYDTDQAFPSFGARTDTRALFGQTMGLVAVTTGLFALGAYLARNLPGGWGVIFWLASLGGLLAMNLTVRQSEQLTLGAAVRLRPAGRPGHRAHHRLLRQRRPEAVWEAGGATALFVAGFGAAGYATRRDLSALARLLWWALIALIGFGVLLIFASIPGGAVVYALGGLVIFAGLVMYDFQRLRASTQLDSAPLLAPRSSSTSSTSSSSSSPCSAGPAGDRSDPATDDAPLIPRGVQPALASKEVAMTSTTSTTSTASTSNPVQDAVPAGVRDLSAGWWWFLSLGVLWTLFGAYVLSYRVGSLAAVAALVGVAFLFGGITQLAVATRVQSWRWLFIVAGILGVAAGILTLVWPAITLYVVSILVAWYLIIFGIMHLVGALVGPKLAYWWTQLPLGVAELVLGVWAVRSWERSLVTLVTLVGVWAIVHGVAEIFAAFSVRQTSRRAEHLVG